ncbi:MAG: ATP-binding protein [Aeromicrobium sp.]|uniref:sensor histidine kinase n=1 Tax=Aeromicrobium sp. TaxID=1871063 RepID=UPI0039E3DE38
MTRRLVLITMALIAVVGVSVSALATLTMSSVLTDRLDEQLHASLDRATRELDESPSSGPPRPGGAGPVPAPLGQGEGTLTAVADDGSWIGMTIGDGDRAHVSEAVIEALAAVPADGETHTVDLADLGGYRVLVVEEEDGLQVAAGLPTTDRDETLATLLWWEVALTLAGVAVAGVAGRTLVRRELRPLREVAATAHQVAVLPLSSGEVGTTPRVAERLSDPSTEVGQVGAALNAMLEHIELSLAERHASEERLRQFVADASHELRTPLTTIAGYTELLRAGADAETLAQALDRIDSEAGRMSGLVADLLLLARLDAGRPLEAEEVDLTRLLVETVSDRQVVDRDRQWRLDLPDEPVTVTGDDQRLHQVVVNLLSNASRHTPEGTVVTARLRAEPGRAVVEVHDTGPGLPAELVPRVFDRFARGDSSRTRASGGAGLGASLVRAIAEAHGGSAQVESAPGDTTFRVSLPR